MENWICYWSCYWCQSGVTVKVLAEAVCVWGSCSLFTVAPSTSQKRPPEPWEESKVILTTTQDKRLCCQRTSWPCEPSEALPKNKPTRLSPRVPCVDTLGALLFDEGNRFRQQLNHQSERCKYGWSIWVREKEGRWSTAISTRSTLNCCWSWQTYRECSCYSHICLFILFFLNQRYY